MYPNLENSTTQSVFMSESTRDIFPHHIGHIRDDIYHLGKKIQPGTKVWNLSVTFWGHYLSTPILKKAKLNHFQCQKVLEYFFDHICHRRDDMCDTSKKIQPGTNENTQNNHFSVGIFHGP